MKAAQIQQIQVDYNHDQNGNFQLTRQLGKLFVL